MTEDDELLAQLKQLLADAKKTGDTDKIAEFESDIANLFPGETPSRGEADT